MLLERKCEVRCFESNALIMVIVRAYIAFPILPFDHKRRNKVILHMLERAEDVPGYSQVCDYPLFSTLHHVQEVIQTQLVGHALILGLGISLARGMAQRSAGPSEERWESIS